MDTHLSRYEPLLPSNWFGHNSWNCHEWRTKSGRIMLYDCVHGVLLVDPQPHHTSVVWLRPVTHAESYRNGCWLAGYENCYNWNEQHPCSVWFFNWESGREWPVVSAMPPHSLSLPW